MSKDQRRAQTKKALLDALVICLEDQDFNDILPFVWFKQLGLAVRVFIPTTKISMK